MVDERAVYAAIQGYASVGPMRAPDTWIFDAIKAAIEAYEAAKWRPIEEAPPRDGTEILIHWPKDGPSALSGSWLTRWSHEGCWGHGEGALMPNSPLLKGAMFRTIDPPKQDAVSRGTSTPPAAEASS